MRTAHGVTSISLLVTLLASPASAQHTTPACDRVATTRITFGAEGGNMRPLRTTFWPGGLVTRQHGSLSTPDTLRPADTAAVQSLARRAWAGALVRHTLSARTALANRDAAHPFIELVSACERRRAEYRVGEAPRQFLALLAALDSIAR